MTSTSELADMISEVFNSIHEAVDMETGEVDVELHQKLDITLSDLLKDFSNKLDGCAQYVKGLDGLIERYKKEAADFKAKAEAAENKKERLKDYIGWCMNLAKQKKHEGAMTITMSPGRASVGRVDKDALADNFKEIVEEVKIKKKNILEFYKENGQAPTGVEIVTGPESVRIK